MTNQSYTEAELVANRASLLLFGGSATDRRAWAEEAHRPLAHEGPLKEVATSADVDAALALKSGVVFVPELTALSYDDQGKLVRLLQEREERPKLVLALSAPVAAARESGRLREDLLYRLSQAQVDLSPAELKQAIRERRERAARIAEKAAAKLQKAQKPAAARKPVVKTAARRPRPPVKAAKKTKAAKAKARPARPIRSAKKAKKR